MGISLFRITASQQAQWKASSQLAFGLVTKGISWEAPGRDSQLSSRLSRSKLYLFSCWEDLSFLLSCFWKMPKPKRRRCSSITQELNALDAEKVVVAVLATQVLLTLAVNDCGPRYRRFWCGGAPGSELGAPGWETGARTWGLQLFPLQQLGLWWIYSLW